MLINSTADIATVHVRQPFPSSISLEQMSQQEATPVKEEAFTSTHKPITVGGQSQVAVGTTHISRLTDEQLIKEFLSGSYCLHGVRADHLSSSSSSRVLATGFTTSASALQGVGWWKYEFCYGKHVHQYHEVSIGSFSNKTFS